VTEVAATPSWRNRPGVVVGLCVLVYLPFTLLGYGTDLDVANVLRAGRSWVEDGDYQMSRGPGSSVHELSVGVLDGVGGSVLVNLASLAFAALALWSVHVLVRSDRGRWPSWCVLVLATNPWFWIAATSLGDFVWALGLLLGGAVLARRDRRLLAGLLFGLAIGTRASSLLLVLAWLVAEATGEPAGRVPPRLVVRSAVVSLVVGLVCFIPPWLDADRTLAFIDNELQFVGFGVHLGRWAVKNLALFGVPAAVVLLVGLPKLVGALNRWSASTLVRFSVLAILASEILFFRFPFKPVHLLPVVAATALLVGASPLVTQRWVAALVVAQLVGGLVGATVAAPDVENAARSGRLDLSITAGPLVTEVRCRLDDRDLGPWPDPASEAATQRAATNSTCQNAAWRGD
jgi:hypothetical protein